MARSTLERPPKGADQDLPSGLHAEALIVADCDITLSQAHAIGEEARHAMQRALPKLPGVKVHVDPLHPDGRDAHADLAHHDSRAPAGLR